MTDSDVKTAARLISSLPDIPNRFEFNIRSWHDGARRQYSCTLVDTQQHREWTTPPCDDLRSAYMAAIDAAGIPVVDKRFWFGVRSAIPVTLLLWIGLLVAAGIVWHWLR